jgi:hypothetical protein
MRGGNIFRTRRALQHSSTPAIYHAVAIAAGIQGDDRRAKRERFHYGNNGPALRFAGMKKQVHVFLFIEFKDFFIWEETKEGEVNALLPSKSLACVFSSVSNSPLPM